MMPKLIDSEKGVFRAFPAEALTVGDDESSLISTFALANSLTQSRLCLHKDDQSTLQCMLIFHAINHIVKKHAHSDKDEVIVLTKGRMQILMYKDEKVIKSCTLDADPSSGCDTICFIRKNTVHNMIFYSDVLFLEISTGPFRRENLIFS